jgi:hypothetical protein
MSIFFVYHFVDWGTQKLHSLDTLPSALVDFYEVYCEKILKLFTVVLDNDSKKNFVRVNDAHEFWYVLVFYMIIFIVMMCTLTYAKLNTWGSSAEDIKKGYVEIWGLAAIFLAITLLFCVFFWNTHYLLHFLYMTHVLCCVQYVVETVCISIWSCVEHKCFNLSVYMIPIYIIFAVCLQPSVYYEIEQLMDLTDKTCIPYIFTFVKIAVKILTLYLIVVVFNATLSCSMQHIGESIEVLFTLIFLYADSILHLFDSIMPFSAEYIPYLLYAFWLYYILLIITSVTLYDGKQYWRIIAFNWYTMTLSSARICTWRILVSLFVMFAEGVWTLVIIFFYAHTVFTCKMLIQFWFPNTEYNSAHMNFNPLLLWK